MGAEELKPYLKQYVESITKKSKNGGLYDCPICPSGTGKHKSGAFSVKGDLWQCFSCHQKGDTVDLIKLHENISDTGEAVQWGEERFNLSSGKYRPGKKEKKEVEQVSEKEKQMTEEQKTKELQPFFAEAMRNRNKTDYLTKRGISEKTQALFNVGYIENYESYGACVIIPTSTFSYMFRQVNGDIKRNGKGEIKLFNTLALEQDKQPIFVVEGAIDAMSIVEVGGEAVGLNGTSGTAKLLKLLEEQKPKQPLIICLDNDEAGNTASNDLETALQGLQVLYYKGKPIKEYKDPNEALQGNRAYFAEYVKQAQEQAYTSVSELEEIYSLERKAFRQEFSATSFVPKLNNEIEESKHRKLIKTGFANTDEMLGGGLYTGLYILGAGSSIGKTTFILQVADQLAQSGQDVLFFSLEMGATELVAKSLSRITDIQSRENRNDDFYSSTFRQITTGQNYKNYSQEKIAYIEDSKKEYMTYSNNLFIKECIFNFTIDMMKEEIEKHIKITGKKPVVMLDYLQIVEPLNERYSDKQNADKTIKALKVASRNYGIPLIAISSINRASYGKGLTMQSFKESGGIEYGCDVLLSLEFADIESDYSEEKEMALKAQDDRNVRLKVLKNRNGVIGKTSNFKYYAMYNRFEEQ